MSLLDQILQTEARRRIAELRVQGMLDKIEKVGAEYEASKTKLHG